MNLELEHLKEEAAKRAVAYIQSGMRVGLGTGSTSKYAILELGRKVREGELTDITCVATSEQSAQLAQALELVVEPLDPRPLDIAIDGADEVDPELNLIKGLGAALLREKLVECQAKQFIVIADYSKKVNKLGEKSPLPVEIVAFGYESTLRRLGQWGSPTLRMQGDKPLVTDNGNYIADLRFTSADVVGLERILKSTTGVVETGFFLGMAQRVILAHPNHIEELNAEITRRLYGEDK